MRDLHVPAAMWIKGVLLLVIGLTASILLMLQLGTLTGALLLALSIWSFCRAYYFAFYVIEKYVDPTYRFSGLLSFLSYIVRRKRNG